jgi:nuclear pore complex protein Nup133
MEGGQELWALVDSRLQRWDVKLEGWEEIVLEKELISLVRRAMRDTFRHGIERDDAKLDLELVDLATEGYPNLIKPTS